MDKNYIIITVGVVLILLYRSQTAVRHIRYVFGWLISIKDMGLESMYTDQQKNFLSKLAILLAGILFIVRGLLGIIYG